MTHDTTRPLTADDAIGAPAATPPGAAPDPAAAVSTDAGNIGGDRPTRAPAAATTTPSVAVLPGPVDACAPAIHDSPETTPRTVSATSVLPARSSSATVAVDAAEPPAVSVWTTAQSAPATQRKGRYVPASTAHPAKMLPEVVRHAVAHYTRPGDLVLDPMCGIGTTLVEAVHLGRRAIGVEYEPHWVDIARANLDIAREQGVAGANGVDAGVFHGDARQLATQLPLAYVGQVALVVTSPPYGPSTHGQVAVAPGEGIQKYHHRYGSTLDRGNLANIGHHRLLAGFTRILAALRVFLNPSGRIAITLRPWREHAELIDLPAQILACGRAAGLVAVERNVALLARAADADLVARGSFFQRDFIRKQREAGLPLHLIAHEDLLVFALDPATTQTPAAAAQALTTTATAAESTASATDLTRYRTTRTAERAGAYSVEQTAPRGAAGDGGGRDELDTAVEAGLDSSVDGGVEEHRAA